MTDPTTTTTPDSLPPMDADLAARVRMAPLPPPPPPSSPASCAHRRSAEFGHGGSRRTSASPISRLAAAAADLAYPSPVSPLPGTLRPRRWWATPPSAWSPASTPTPACEGHGFGSARRPSCHSARSVTPVSAAIAAAAPGAPTVTGTDPGSRSGPERSRRAAGHTPIAAGGHAGGIVGVPHARSCGGGDERMGRRRARGDAGAGHGAPIRAAATAPATTRCANDRPLRRRPPLRRRRRRRSSGVPSYADDCRMDRPNRWSPCSTARPSTWSGWVASPAKLEPARDAGAGQRRRSDRHGRREQCGSDPAVPWSIERSGDRDRTVLASAPGSSERQPSSAAPSSNRVANVLDALPNVTVTVVGHADQVGDEAANCAPLGGPRGVGRALPTSARASTPAGCRLGPWAERDLLAERCSPTPRWR